MKKYNICVVTGTRAEYGLLKPLIKRIDESDNVQLKLVVTGMHLSPEFGMTYREIEQDRFQIASKIEMLMSSDTPAGITKSMGVELIGFADYFSTDRPDILVLLGDRYEALIAATAALIARIPIAHIHGGEVTEGVIDEAIRHSITKMSHLHFSATEVYRKRIIQLGEKPENVYNVGSLGVENIKNVHLLGKNELEKSIGFSLAEKTVLVTFHPVTLENATAKDDFAKLLNFFDKHPEVHIIFTKANSDTDGRGINQLIDKYVAQNTERCIAFSSLGQLRYLSALQYMYMVIGNSSSGIIEVPSFHIPTIDIGSRQRGRVCAESVVHCKIDGLEEAFSKASDKTFRAHILDVQNPYEGEAPSKMIFEKICEQLDEGIDIKKGFFDISI